MARIHHPLLNDFHAASNPQFVFGENRMTLTIRSTCYIGSYDPGHSASASAGFEQTASRACAKDINLCAAHAYLERARRGRHSLF